MKKTLLGLLITAFVTISATATVSATPPQTGVTGVVTENQMSVSGATVTVLCNGHSEVDTSDARGSYLVTFPSNDCPFGSTVRVTAQKGGKSGVASGTVTGVTTKLNLAIVNVSIPEYGFIGSLVASSAGIGAIAYMRRRQKQTQL